MTQKTWVLASSNEGKLFEFRHGLAPFLEGQGIGLVSQSSLGLEPAYEPYRTFEENALAKARHACGQSGLPAIADDSGLCVDALGGAPGVRSARYFKDALEAGDTDARRFEGYNSDEANSQLLLHRLFGKTNRVAHFVCAIAFVKSADDPDPIMVTGTWNGQITEAPRGLGGFGYDPVFFDPGFRLTAAEMTISEKQSVSHRGRALRQLVKQLSLQSQT